MGILKDFALFFSYKKIVSKNKTDLQSKFNIRVDNADRMYTVLNVPETLFEEPYNIRKADIDMISENYIKDYVSSLSNHLNSIGLSEMYGFYEPIKKVDKYSYLIIIGYKQIDSVDINRVIYRILLPLLLISGLLSLIIYLIR